MKKVFLLFVFLIFVTQGISGERPLRIGSFNIQVFGRSKMQLPPINRKVSTRDLKKWENKKHVVPTLIKIVKRYDLLFIQEIRERKIPKNLSNNYKPAILTLLNEVNLGLPYGKLYKMTLSKRLGRRHSKTKEQYAYFYREDKLKIIDKLHYANYMAGTTFARPPYVVRFRSTLNKKFDFSVIGLHSEPQKAFTEVKQLKDVYHHIKDLWGEEDSLLLGDLNASCQYLENQSLGELYDLLMRNPDRYDLQVLHRYTDKELSVMFPKYKYQYNPLDTDFIWHITNYVKTTVGTTSHCAYDRLISTADVSKRVIKGSAKTYPFDKKYFPRESKLIQGFIKKDVQRTLYRKTNKSLRPYRGTKEERRAIEKMRDISDHYPVELLLRVLDT
ncbi:MAG: endonuclease/exonuclease/phosphatase family protein [Bdellovibrionota bacterium]|nr:endonuclease/exonuclease/phosphatase family protein [Bdellovibrionota bacterium]